MRALLIIVVLASGTVSLFGQGVIGFANNGSLSPEDKVYIDDWLNPAALAPGGGQFLVALYFAPLSAGEMSLTQVGGPTPFLGRSDQRYGLFFGGNRTVATDYAGGPGLFQVKGWEAAYGGAYEEAAANPAARVGHSPVFIADTADRVHTLEAILGLVESSYADRPFRGFVIAVPEPATGVLVFVGMGAAVVVMRSKGENR